MGALFERERPLRAVIHAFKYAAHHEFASLLVEKLWGADMPLPEDVVVIPVPLHSSRLLERGYNQAALLGRSFARRGGLSYREDVLIRRVATEAQAQKSRSERYENVRDAFAILVEAPKHVLLVDDVATTCATLDACARILKDAGSLVVQGLVLARGDGAGYTAPTFASPSASP